jgi:hypothetical protein
LASAESEIISAAQPELPLVQPDHLTRPQAFDGRIGEDECLPSVEKPGTRLAPMLHRGRQVVELGAVGGPIAVEEKVEVFTRGLGLSGVGQPDACRIRSTWVGVAEAMTTASTLRSSMAASTLGAGYAVSLGHFPRRRLDRVVHPSQLGSGMDIDRVGVYASDPSRTKKGEADQRAPSSSCASSVSSSPPAICRVSSSSDTSPLFLSRTARPSFKMMKWLPTRYA